MVGRAVEVGYNRREMLLHSPYYVLVPLVLGGGATFVGFLGGWNRWPMWLTLTVCGALSAVTIGAVLGLAWMTVCVLEPCVYKP